MFLRKPSCGHEVKRPSKLLPFRVRNRGLKARNVQFFSGRMCVFKTFEDCLWNIDFRNPFEGLGLKIGFSTVGCKYSAEVEELCRKAAQLLNNKRDVLEVGEEIGFLGEMFFMVFVCSCSWVCFFFKIEVFWSSIIFHFEAGQGRFWDGKAYL